MSDFESPALELYIGGPILHQSERSTLQEIERVLAADGPRGIVFCEYQRRLPPDRFRGGSRRPRAGHRGENQQSTHPGRRERALAGPSGVRRLEGYPESLSSGTRCCVCRQELNARVLQEQCAVCCCIARFRARYPAWFKSVKDQPQGVGHGT